MAKAEVRKASHRLPTKPDIRATMASSTKRTRSERVASLKLEPSDLSRWIRTLLTGPALLRFALSLVTAVLLVVIFQGWKPPFAYREGQIPQRDVLARVEFEIVDINKTEAEREQARRQVACFYENQPDEITDLNARLRGALGALAGENAFADLTKQQSEALESFVAPSEDENSPLPGDALLLIRTFLSEHGVLDDGKLDLLLKSILAPIADTGILTQLAHSAEEGEQGQILVDGVVVNVAKIRRTEVVAALPQRVSEEFQKTFNSPEVQVVAQFVSKFLVDNLPQATLTYERDASEEERRKAEESVKDALVAYYPAVSKLAEAGKPLSREEQLPVLRAEYEAWVAQLSWGEVCMRVVAFSGMVSAMFLLCGLLIHFQYEVDLVSGIAELARLLATVLATCLVCRFFAADPFRAELIPLVLCGMTLTIVYGRQLGLLVTTCVALTVTLGMGHDIGDFVTICSGVCSAAFLIGRIRTRNKLIYVGLATAVVVAATSLGVSIVQDKIHAYVPVADSTSAIVTGWRSVLPSLLQESLRQGGFVLLAAATTAGFLSFIERGYGVQTDLSLLELGDASHVLLRQLAQRAPGTYNHSINVAAIAEAAADAIGAHGLLTRVGAYFHDIGKMFKPNYFVENQEQGGNRHDQLQPAMSTLVIIAHVKDGADLGRQHRLPKPIIDFIEQHHGTTLVEYFFREAEKRSQEDPNKEEVSETSFRYPGPKPQTLEAAVLMLADSVESASRTLVEPTPSRIQNLVDDIAMKKLLDGQFDECGLTLQQLEQVKTSLVKSLTAIYHGRVKYSGQASA